MARVQLPTSRLKARRRARRMFAVLGALVVLLALMGGVVGLSYLSALRVQHITIVGLSSVNESLVEASVQDALDGGYWHLIPKNNIFVYPKGAIERGLLAQFPIFSSVVAHAQGLTALTVTVTERQPAALWCGSFATSTAPCLTLDESGTAYTIAPDFSASVYRRYTGPLATTTLPRQFLTPEKFRALSALADAIASKAASSTLDTISIDASGEVHMQFASGFTLMFILSGDGADVAQRFALALTADPFNKHPLSDFEYLDLRFGDKLYYKLR